jgi:hypothetical protein
MQAIHEYLALWDTVQDIQLNDQPDQTFWRWANDGTYSAKLAYSMLHSASTPFRGHKLIWKTWASDQDLSLAGLQASSLDR